jgi:PD-(D/E)XK nuclease superfamily protein
MSTFDRKLSWSSIQSLLSCGQKFRYQQQERLERIPTAAHFGRLRGTFFHAAVASALLGHRPLDGMREEREKEELKFANVFDRQELDDTMNRAFKEAAELAEYHIPKLGIGTSIEPLLVEGEFSFHFSRDFDFNGRYDAIIRDLETNETVLVDWKLRDGFNSIEAAMMDGQLYAYAYALRQLGTEVDAIRFYEFSSKQPSPASIKISKGVPTGYPNTGAASYDTTWERWSSDVRRFGVVDPENYRDEMEGKLKTDADFMNIINLPLTPASYRETERRLTAARELLAFNVSQAVPTAAYSSFICKGCDFLKLCISEGRHGIDATELKKRYYVTRK